MIASSNPKDLADANKLILPGVGSFDEGIKNLKKFGLYDFLVDCFGSEKKNHLVFVWACNFQPII